MERDRVARGGRLLKARLTAGMLAVAAAMACGGAATTVDRATAATPTATLSAVLAPPEGALFGIYGGPRAGRDPSQEMMYLEKLVGRRFDIDRQFHRWDKPFPTLHEATAIKRGSIPALSWAPVTQAGTRVRWSDIAKGTQDAWIGARADAVKVFGKKILLAFHAEPEDDATWAGTPADYRAAWRRIVSIFRERGATNAVWTWTMMAYTFQAGSGRNPLDWYPGDDVIDWLAADGYNWYASMHQQGGNAPWRSFQAIFQPFYDWGKSRGKPLAAWETGVLEDTKSPDPLRKAQWFKDAATTIKNWPQMKAVIYFNAHGWYFDSSKPATDAYKAWGADPHFNPLTRLAADTLAPVVTLTSPSPAATVSGTVSVTASANDNVGVTKVEFLVEGVVRSTDSAAPYAFSWATMSTQDGKALLQARAYDAAGNAASSAVVAVNVANGGASGSGQPAAPPAGKSPPPSTNPQVSPRPKPQIVRVRVARRSFRVVLAKVPAGGVVRLVVKNASAKAGRLWLAGGRRTLKTAVIRPRKTVRYRARLRTGTVYHLWFKAGGSSRAGSATRFRAR
ncbi:MAG: Ig-like domain-containing protein [Gaiellaceae bacterium]